MRFVLGGSSQGWRVLFPFNNIPSAFTWIPTPQKKTKQNKITNTQVLTRLNQLIHARMMSVLFQMPWDWGNATPCLSPPSCEKKISYMHVNSLQSSAC